MTLAEKIFAGEAEVSYVYSASGAKLATKVGSSFTYYRGSFIYNDSELDHIIQPEGMIRKATGGYVYYYTRKDHLGSTRVLCHEANGVMKADQNTDYYAFGLSIRSNDTNLNRYLFNGKELQDQTVNGKGLMLYDYGARNYDPMLGRWFNIDPALQFTNPYIYCANNPVRFIDPDGKRINILAHNDGRPKHYDWEKGTNNWSFYSSEIQTDGTITKVPYEFGSDAYVDQVTIALNKLMSKEVGNWLVTSIAEMDEVVKIGKGDENAFFKKNSKTAAGITWNPKGSPKLSPTKNGKDMNVPFVSLGHELAHAWDSSQGTLNNGLWFSEIGENGATLNVRNNEIYATHIENQIRAEQSLALRTHYAADRSGRGTGPRI